MPNIAHKSNVLLLTQNMNCRKTLHLQYGQTVPGVRFKYFFHLKTFLFVEQKEQHERKENVFVFLYL